MRKFTAARKKIPKGLLWLTATVFVLTAMPRLSIKFGPLPLYAIDLLIIITLFYSLKMKAVYSGKRPFSGFIILIIFFAILGEIAAMSYSGQLFAPIYLLIRTFLAVSLFYSASKILRSRNDLLLVFKAASLGIGITVMLMIMTSLPFTRGLVVSSIFSISYLEPSFVFTAKRYSMEAFQDVGVRGKSLIGVSILSGAFINVMWPFISLLIRWPWNLGFWRKIAIVVCILSPIAVVMSYSRGAILGMFLVIGGTLFFGSSRNRQGIIVAVLMSVTIFSFVGWDSDVFFFERIENRYTAMIDNPFEDERESERILSYVEPFEHMVENPHFIIVGEGTSITKTGVISEQSGKATHSVFSKAYYSYGMVASFIYMFLIVRGFSFTRRQIRIRKRLGDISSLYAQGLFAALLGILPWLVFGHAAVSTPRGAMMFFLLFGMIASLKNFPVTGNTPKVRIKSNVGASPQRNSLSESLNISRRGVIPASHPEK
ncbi:MAG: O-antigen ligase family protein [Arenicellales bacterium]